jgi:transcriptional regulator with XRE-family HTH domain
MPSVGDRIREVREHRRITQDKLAEMAGISKGFLSDVENSKRNISSEYLLRIANSLGTSVDYLLKGESPTADETLKSEPVVIPPALSEAALQLNLTYPQTVELLRAHHSVVARRSNKDIKQFNVSDWIALQKAIKEVFG